LQIDWTGAAARLMDRLARFAAYSDDTDALTRLFLSPAHRHAAEALLGWMREAGLAAGIDAIGNVVGRRAGTDPTAPALMIASHIDTVRDAGRYDGNLGVLIGLSLVEELNRAGVALPFPIEIVAFGDEEGVRFPTALSSSRAVAGSHDPAILDIADEDGILYRDALLRFGGDPAGIAGLARQPGALAAYVEVHIEQGPVLEAENLPVGVVTAISGASRMSVVVEGVAGHAGTVPMGLRSDALAGVAEMILAVEARGRSRDNVVATVGRIDARPGAVNVIPGRVTFTVDVRSPSDKLRECIFKEIAAEITMIGDQRGLSVTISPGHVAAASPCDPALIAGLSEAVKANGHGVHLLPSGAGHDAMVFGDICPIGMLFVRCRGGISHNPAESITEGDAAAALKVLASFVLAFRP